MALGGEVRCGRDSRVQTWWLGDKMHGKASSLRSLCVYWVAFARPHRVSERLEKGVSRR